MKRLEVLARDAMGASSAFSSLEGHGMSSDLKGLYRFGGISLILSGLLFLAKYVLDVMAGPPPSSGAEILVWATSMELPLAITNEVVFFAAGFLVPGVIAMYLSLAPSDRIKAAAGAGMMAVIIPIIFMVLIVHGRLVFPVYGLQTDTPAMAEFVVAIYFGGLHAIGLLLGLATIVLSLAMRRAGWGMTVVLLGIATGVFDFLNAYPEAIGPVLILVSQLLFTAWFLVVGVKLIGIRQVVPVDPLVPAASLP